MKVEEATQKLRNIIRRKHLSLSTEDSYCHWLKQFCSYIRKLPPETSSEEKIEQFLTALAKEEVAASTQNQALNALVFFYREALGVEVKGIDSLRAKRPVRVRHAPSREDTLRLIQEIQSEAGREISLAVRLIYGCGLRVTEPLLLRIKDMDLESGKFVIRGAKGGHDRVVPMPRSVLGDLREQMKSARAVWKEDSKNKIPVTLPGQLAEKYPQWQFGWSWAWLFPAARPCLHPRTGKKVRWRLHEANVQKAVRKICSRLGISILPHELRHAYATHCLNGGANPRAIQEIMGHRSLETTMTYLHAPALSVPSPLDA
jgi:integron integrase